MLKHGKQFVAGTHDGYVAWLGLVLSYLLLARASELFSYDDGGVHAEFCLLRSDLTFFDEHGRVLPWHLRDSAVEVEVNFRASKADQQRRGAKVRQRGLCLDVIRQLIRVAPGLPMNSPLVTNKTGKTVTRRKGTTVLRQMVKALGDQSDAQQYALHSGRIGGATALAAAGLSDAAIMAAGRWKSLAFMVYVRPNSGDSRAVAAALTTMQH